jgi:hypothetical protein
MMGDLGDYIYLWPQSGVPPVLQHNARQPERRRDGGRGGERERARGRE